MLTISANILDIADLEHSGVCWTRESYYKFRESKSFIFSYSFILFFSKQGLLQPNDSVAVQVFIKEVVKCGLIDGFVENVAAAGFLGLFENVVVARNGDDRGPIKVLHF